MHVLTIQVGCPVKVQASRLHAELNSFSWLLICWSCCHWLPLVYCWCLVCFWGQMFCRYSCTYYSTSTPRSKPPTAHLYCWC